LIAAALLDDAVGPAQLEPSRILAGDAQALLAKVEIHPDKILTARYPHELGARITIQTRTGKILEREQSDYEGGLGNPLSWEREVEKFNWLSEPFADASLRNEIVELVADLHRHSIADLMKLLVKVSPRPVFAATRHTFQ
jgi:2-methylcitrate dehydratase